MSYVCPCCGQIHEGLPDLAFDRPAYAHAIPEAERGQRVRLNEDLCVVDETYYFIRGFVEVPILGQTETFGIGAWVSQKPENFRTYVEHFDTEEIGPFFGWFSNDFTVGGTSTLNLKTRVHFQGRGLRSKIELELTDHPLARAQREGIRLEEAWALVHACLDPSTLY